MDFITCLKQLNDFVVFGTLKQVFEFLGLFFLLGFGLKLFQFDWFYFFTGLVRFLGDFRGKLDGFCSKVILMRISVQIANGGQEILMHPESIKWRKIQKI